METSLEAILSANVRAFMDFHDWVEADVAKRTGLGTGTIWRVLNGQNITFGSLSKLAKGLGRPAWALLVSELDPATMPVADIQERIDARIEERAQEVAHTMLADALHEQRLRKKASAGRRRGDKPAAARQAPQEKPPVRNRTVGK